MLFPEGKWPPQPNMLSMDLALRGRGGATGEVAISVKATTTVVVGLPQGVLRVFELERLGVGEFVSCVRQRKIEEKVGSGK